MHLLMFLAHSCIFLRNLFNNGHTEALVFLLISSDDLGEPGVAHWAL
jgi:hypothetical protein